MNPNEKKMTKMTFTFKRLAMVFLLILAASIDAGAAASSWSVSSPDGLCAISVSLGAGGD